MDFRERILTTMNHEEPDRVPVMSMLNEPSSAFLYRGKTSTGYFNLLKKPILKEIVRGMMNWDRVYNWQFTNIFKDILEVSTELGFDCTWLMYMLFKVKKEKPLPLGLAWYDAFGRKWEIAVDGVGNPEPFYIGGYCNTEEKWNDWVESKAHLIEKNIKFTTKFQKKLIEACGSKIYIFSFVAPGIWENSWQPIGFVEFVKFIYEKPKFIERVVEYQTDIYLKLLESVCQVSNEIVLLGDDLGQKTGPLMSPKLIDRFFGDSYRRIAELVHKKGKKLLFHSCGNIYKLLDQFIDYGFDGLVTLEPTASMELGKVREMVGHDLVLVGNLDVSYLLVRGSKKEVRDAVKKAIKDAAKGGGFILSPTHNHAAVDPTRLQWLVEAAHEFGTYPLQV